MITSSVRRQASSHLAFSCSSVSCWLASFNMQSFVIHSYSHFNSDIMLSKVVQFVILEFCAVGSRVLYRRPRGIVIHSPQWRRFAKHHFMDYNGAIERLWSSNWQRNPSGKSCGCVEEARPKRMRIAILSYCAFRAVPCQISHFVLILVPWWWYSLRAQDISQRLDLWHGCWKPVGSSKSIEFNPVYTYISAGKIYILWLRYTLHNSLITTQERQFRNFEVSVNLIQMVHKFSLPHLWFMFCAKSISQVIQLSICIKCTLFSPTTIHRILGDRERHARFNQEAWQ